MRYSIEVFMIKLFLQTKGFWLCDDIPNEIHSILEFSRLEYIFINGVSLEAYLSRAPFSLTTKPKARF